MAYRVLEGGLLVGILCLTILVANAAFDDLDLLESCMDMKSGLICNHRGDCQYGGCLCRASYYGVYCECNDTKCPTYKGAMCSGNGKCVCGRCVCNSGKSGLACQETAGNKGRKSG